MRSAVGIRPATTTSLTTLSRRHATATAFILSLSSPNPPSSVPWLANHRLMRRAVGVTICTGNSPSGGRRLRRDGAAADGLSCITGRPIPYLHPSSPLLRPLQLRHRHPLMSSFNSTSTSVEPSSLQTVRVVIKGRVQGVFYRNWTVDNAQQLELKGWVRNRRDGSVEALFSGRPESIAEMEERCRRGPPDAIVTGLQVYPSSEELGQRFECRPTV